MTLDIQNLKFSELAEFTRAAEQNKVTNDTEVHYDPEAHTLSISFDSKDSEDNGSTSTSQKAFLNDRVISPEIGEQVVNGVIDFLTKKRNPPSGGYGSFL